MTDQPKPYRSGPAQPTVRIPGLDAQHALGSFVLRRFWKANGDGRVLWVDFELFECTSYPTDNPDAWEFERKGAMEGWDTTPNLDEAQPVAEGFVKWDGCTQFDVASVHVDSKHGLLNLFHGIGEARRLCAEAMGDAYDRSEYS